MPRTGLSRTLAAAALAATVLLAGCSTTGADEPVRGADQQGYVGSGGALTRIDPDQRTAAPTLTGPQLGSDKTVSTADYAGKVLVLNVWGSWCPPCRAEAKDLQAASVATRADAQFVGINTRDFAPAAPEAFLRAQGITYPSIFDPSGKTLLQLGGQVPPSAIPSTLVLDRQGRVAIRALGPVSKTTLTEMVSQVAAGR